MNNQDFYKNWNFQIYGNYEKLIKLLMTPMEEVYAKFFYDSQTKIDENAKALDDFSVKKRISILCTIREGIDAIKDTYKSSKD